MLRNQPYGSHPRQISDVYTATSPGSAVVVFVHGGSWSGGSKDIYGFMGKSLVKLGITAVIINYRLRPEVDFPAYIEDAASALKWVHAEASEWGADPDRIFIMGHSAGGHIAACAALGNYLPDAKWFRGMIGIAGAYDVHPGQNPNADPNNLIKPINRRFLLIHGRRDLTVNMRSSQRLFNSLQRAGIPAELKKYNLGHMTIMAGFFPVLRRFSSLPKTISQFIRS